MVQLAMMARLTCTHREGFLGPRDVGTQDTHFYHRRGHPHQRHREGCPRGEPPSPRGWVVPASVFASPHPSSVPPPRAKRDEATPRPHHPIPQPQPGEPGAGPHLILPGLRVAHGPQVEVSVPVIVAVHAHKPCHTCGRIKTQVGQGLSSTAPTAPTAQLPPSQCYLGTCGPASSR